MLSIVVFLGMMFGSSLWGALASVYGRKVGTALSLAVEGIAGVMASVAPNFSLLLVFRGLTGIGTGGLATSFSMYAEFLPTGVRGYNLCWYQLFWAVGAVLETILAWLTLPSHGWRVLCLLTALPASNTCFFVVFLDVFSVQLDCFLRSPCCQSRRDICW